MRMSFGVSLPKHGLPLRDRALWFLNSLKPGEVFLRFLLDTQEPALRRKGALLRLLQLRLKSLNTLFGLLQLLRYPLCRADSTIGGLACSLGSLLEHHDDAIADFSAA